MGQNILPGQVLVGGQANGQLNQYYGLADNTTTSVTGIAAAALSTTYTIPAGEATAGSAYRLSCSGSAIWGTTAQTLILRMFVNGAAVGSAQPEIDAAAFPTSATLRWAAVLEMNCADGISSWQVGMLGNINVSGAATITGLAAANNTAGFSDDDAVTASCASAITVAVAANWTSATGAPSVTCHRTIFQKVA